MDELSNCIYLTFAGISKKEGKTPVDSKAKIRRKDNWHIL